ncbi:MAG TPA: hypothetical protein VK817_07305, partial [Trebonia sp.]|nr:hypothetical protein [Trebonia sp.]
LREHFEHNPAGSKMVYAPFAPYGVAGRRGLIPWGMSEPECKFFWLADAAVDPGMWPIVGKVEMIEGEEWHRYEIPVPEFVYRVIADPEFEPFTMASPLWPPTFGRTETFGPDA